MAPSFRTPRKGGFTLLEILVVTAIAALLVVTAASLLVTMSSQRAANRKRLDRLTASFTAMTLLERSMLNAGYHFPSARFGFRVYDNVTTGSYGGIAVSGACGGVGCIVPNTDVLEVVEGAIPQPGQVSNAMIRDGGGGGYDMAVWSPGGPLYQADAGTGSFLFLVGMSDGGNCAAIGTMGDPTSNPYGYSVGMVDRDLAAVANTYYSTSSGVPEHSYNCPMMANSTDMTVSVAAARHLYMVLANDGGVRGLYQKDIPVISTALTASVDGGALTPLARGIDNFQVMPLIAQAGSGITTGCSNGVCECNTGTGSCSLTGANTPAEFGMLGRIIGVKIGLSARGETDDFISEGLPNVVPNRLGNETMAADNVKRTSQTQTYMLRNFAQVSP